MCWLLWCTWRLRYGGGGGGNMGWHARGLSAAAGTKGGAKGESGRSRPSRGDMPAALLPLPQLLLPQLALPLALPLQSHAHVLLLLLVALVALAALAALVAVGLGAALPGLLW